MSLIELVIALQWLENRLSEITNPIPLSEEEEEMLSLIVAKKELKKQIELKVKGVLNKVQKKRVD